MSNNSVIISHDSGQKKSISVKKGPQYVQKNWASKNKFALLSDIDPQSHWDDQGVPIMPKNQFECNRRKTPTHKVGAQCIDYQAVNPCVIGPDTDNTTTCRVTTNLQQKTCDAKDKYELDLRFHVRHKSKMGKAKASNTFKLWDNYGFIPIQDQILPEVDSPSAKNTNTWEEHAAFISTGTYNFMKAQIPIISHLNIESWKKHLNNYWDKQIIFLIKYGLPLDFDPDISLNHTIINHRSEMDHPQDIKAYLEEEKNLQAILGPYNVSPLSNLHISPLMARDKSGAKEEKGHS